MYGILRKKWLRSDRFWAHPTVKRSFLKYIPLFFDTWALMKSQYWPRGRIMSLQSERLRDVLSCARTVPFWKKNIEKADIHPAASVQEIFSRIPITAREELSSVGMRELTDSAYLPYSDRDQTSGSTGRPLHFFQDWGCSLRSCAVTERIFRVASKKRYPIVYMRAKERHGFTFYRHHWFYNQSFSSIRYRIGDLTAFTDSFRHGFILYGYTSWVVELAREMEKLNLKLPIRSVMVAGEHLTEHDRKYIECVMGVEVFTLYASREVGFLGFECEQHNMHLNEEWAYIEIVDKGGIPLPEGREGRIIVTTFDNRVMPFIRYDIGDIGSISNRRCECGRTLRTLMFKGRTAEIIEFDDRAVSLLDIAHSIGSFQDTVIRYQIVQTGKMSFVFRVIPGPRFEDKRRELEEYLLRLIHPRADIRFETVDTLSHGENGKAVYFVRDFAPHT